MADDDGVRGLWGGLRGAERRTQKFRATYWRPARTEWRCHGTGAKRRSSLGQIGVTYGGDLLLLAKEVSYETQHQQLHDRL